MYQDFKTSKMNEVRFNRVHEREGEQEGMGASWGMHGGAAKQGAAYVKRGIRQEGTV